MTQMRENQPKRPRLRWDVGMGILLLCCGLALALLTRPAETPQEGNAALRQTISLPYP